MKTGASGITSFSGCVVDEFAFSLEIQSTCRRAIFQYACYRCFVLYWPLCKAVQAPTLHLCTHRVQPACRHLCISLHSLQHQANE